MKRIYFAVFVFIIFSAVVSAQNPEPVNWFAGDMHVHRSCGGSPQPLDTLYGKMNDQNIAALSLLADMGNGEVQSPTLDLPRVNGSDDPISTSGRIVHWDAEWHWDAIYSQYPHQALGGHIVALGLTEAHQIWQEYTYPIFQWAHSQNAIAGFAHMQYLDSTAFPETLTCCTPVEYPVEVALGSADFISEDVLGSDSAIQAYYRLLNSGFRPGFAAGTDYPCNDGNTIGAPLTYARVANGQMTYRSWIEAIATGHTVVSLNGHREFLNLLVNGTAGPGDEIRMTSGGPVSISVQWNSTQNLSGTIELVSNGAVVASKQASVTSTSPASLTTTINLNKSGWIAARRMGSNGHIVHTAAIFVIVNNAPIRVNTADPQFYISWIDRMLTKTSAGGDWNWYFPTSLTAAQSRYQNARSVYQQVLKEAQGSAPTLSSISITPGYPTIASGSTQQFVASGTYSDGSTVNISSQATWTSSNSSVASVNQRGLAAAINNGTTTISASQSGVTGAATLTVQTSPLAIADQLLAAGTVGSAYSASLSASGGTPPYTWSIASGSLPSGLSLSGTTGAISGTPTASGTFSFMVEVIDSASPNQAATKSFTISITAATGCPCSLWPTTANPSMADSGPDAAVELGVTFRADSDGYIAGLRFYKSAGNTGTHVGNLWTSSGTLLASVTFTNETASGWQQVNFTSPVAIKANTLYVASYHSNIGHYADDQYYFTNALDRSPLHAPAASSVGNGVYAYGSSSTFPTQTWNASNYWVDVVFVPAGPDTTPPLVSSVSPTAGSNGVSAQPSVLAVFSEALDSATVNTSSFQLLDSNSALVPATITYDTSTYTAKLAPNGALSYGSSYTALIKGGLVKDLAGNALAADYSWSFAISAAPAPPPNEGPGGPILVISSAVNPFSRYYAEILRAEGLNEFTAMDISLVTSDILASYDIAVLGDFALTSDQVSMITNWVTNGGNLIAMHPDKQLAGLLGLNDNSAVLNEGYLQFNTTLGPGVGLVNQTIQFHGGADLYSLNGATTLATLYSTASATTSKPAVTLKVAGAGQAAAFTYDLARSVVYTRQGNPNWSGQSRDGQSGPIRSDSLYFGGASFDVEADYVDFARIAIPQADEQQRLLANLILQMNQNKRPLPRFWYLPRNLKAVVVMTGDDHGALYGGGATADRFDYFDSVSPANCSVADWQCVRSTAYLLAPVVATNPLTDAQAANYISEGFEVAAHVDSVPDCIDWTITSLNSYYSTQISSFLARYPHVAGQKTHRMHCVSWSDYDSQPQVELQNGIRLDTTYYYWPDAWINNRPGLFTGSGMAMRFAKRDGTMLDIYQAATQMTDESGQTYPLHINTLLDNALGASGYYGMFVANMHNDSGYSEAAATIVESAQARGIPVISAAQLLTWLDGRNGSSFKSLSWNGNVLSFSISAGSGANGLQAMLPYNAGSGTLGNFTVNSSPVTYSLQTIKGIKYVVFTAGSGNYTATYSSGPQITVASVTLNPSSVLSGASSTGTVTLSAAAPTGGTLVSLSTSDPASATLNASTVIVPQGATTATFTVTANPVASLTTVTITAAYGTSAASAVLTIAPLPTLSALTLNPTVVIGGNGSTATSTLNVAAPTGGAQINLSSANNSLAMVPASVTINAGATTATFPVSTAAVTTQTLVSITGTYAGSTQSATITINPQPAPLVISTPSLSAGTANLAYSATITATGGTLPYTSSISSGTLPTGITLGSSTGTLSGTPTVAGTFTFTVKVVDSGSPAQSATATFTISIATSGSCPCTIWPTTAVPGTPDSGPDGAVEVGVTFTSDADGYITGIRFYKGTGNTGTHIGNLWSSTGTLLSTATFAGESASGWQQVSFSSPVAIKANTQYVASYHTNVGHYADDYNYFLSPVNNSPLHAPANGSGANNGVYAYGSTSSFPTQTWNASNYWVDVVFVPAGTSLLTVSSVSLNPSSVIGGSPSTGTVTLSGSAPSGGAVVSLSTSNGSVTALPQSVTVPQGSTSSSFAVNTSSVTASTTATISGTYNGSSSSATLTVMPLPAISSLALSPATVLGGTTSTGTVTLTQAAPAGGASVTIASANPSVGSVPASVTIPAGSTTASFTVTTSPVATQTAVVVTTTYGSSNKTATITVAPLSISTLTLSPTSVTGGNKSTATVRLNFAAPAGGLTVTLTSANTALATVPQTVAVASNATTATFTVSTNPVASATGVAISASYNGSSKSATLTVNPPALSTLTLSPASVKGGASSTGTVTLTGSAPSSGAVVTLSRSGTNATVPASVTVVSGATTASFTITTNSVTFNTTSRISATYRSTTRTATLTITR